MSPEMEDRDAFSQVDRNIELLEEILCRIENTNGSSIQTTLIQLVVKKNDLLEQTLSIFCSYFLQKRMQKGDSFLESKLLALHSIITTLGKMKESENSALIYKLKREIAKFKKILTAKNAYTKAPYRLSPQRAKPRYD